MEKEQINVIEKRKKNNKSMKKDKSKKKKHPILRAILKLFLIIILLIILFIGGFVGYSTYKNGWGWTGLLKTAVGSEVKTAEELGEFQVLILGISEDISAALTDTIMVASYNPSTQKATLLSIPRDTFVGTSKLRADSYDKINAVYQKYGADGVIERINKLTGLQLKNYIVISNNALVELVDEIGGVEFNVPIDMDYDSKAQDLHIHLKKGLQKLNGEQAEGLVRFRKTNKINGETYSAEYGNDDFGRMRTQRDFIKAIAKQTIKAKNITKVGNLIDIVKRNVTTNIKNWDEIKEYIPYAVEFDTENLQTATIPGESDRIPKGTGLWFFLADETKTKTLVDELFINQNDTDTENSVTSEERAKIKIEILNGSGDSSLLTDATNLLKEQGYNVYKTGKTSTTQTTTIINKSKLSEDITTDIKSLLGTGVISSSSTTSTVDLTIILGKDYKE